MSKGAEKNKLILVIVLFILVALVLAYNMNWLSLGGGSSTPAETGNAGDAGTGATSDTETQPANRRLAPK